MKLFKVSVKTKGGAVFTLLEAENFTYANQLAKTLYGDNLLEVLTTPYLDLEKVRQVIEQNGVEKPHFD